MLPPGGPVALALNSPVTVAPSGPAASASNVVWAVLNNSSPFACQVTTEAGPGPWLQPWEAQQYPLAGLDPTLTVNPSLTISPAVTAGELTVDWYTTSDGPPIGYPVSLTAQAVAATLIQSQVNLGTFTPTFAGSGTQTHNFTVPAGVHINALMLMATGSGSGNWLGHAVVVQGLTSGSTYYEARPLANFASALYATNTFAIVAFPGDYEGTVAFMIISTGASAGITYGVIGLTGVVPPFNPTPEPASTASAYNNAGNSTATILAALTDGRSYRLWSAELTNISGGDARLAQTGAGPGLLEASAAGGNVSVEYAEGLAVASVVLVNATAPTTASFGAVTYDFV